jgi:hypothetical protein
VDQVAVKVVKVAVAQLAQAVLTLGQQVVPVALVLLQV